MADTSYENAVYYARQDILKEFTYSKNVLEKFWGPKEFKGPFDSVTVCGAVNSTPVSGGDAPADGGAGANTTRGLQNQDTPEIGTNIGNTGEDGVTDTTWRRRRSQRQGAQIKLHVTRTEAQTLGMSMEKLLGIKKERMVDAFNFDMLRFMVNGLTMSYWENFDVFGYGTAGHGAGREIPFAHAYRHLIATPNLVNSLQASGQIDAAADTFSAPFTIAGLDAIFAEMANVRAGQKESPETSFRRFDRQANPSSVRPYRNADVNPLQRQLGDPENMPQRVVIMSETGFAAFRETNAFFLGGSEAFNRGDAMFGGAKYYVYNNAVFVTVPDEAMTPAHYTPDPSRPEFPIRVFNDFTNTISSPGALKSMPGTVTPDPGDPRGFYNQNVFTFPFPPSWSNSASNLLSGEVNTGNAGPSARTIYDLDGNPALRIWRKTAKTNSAPLNQDIFLDVVATQRSSAFRPGTASMRLRLGGTIISGTDLLRTGSSHVFEHLSRQELSDKIDDGNRTVGGQDSADLVAVEIIDPPTDGTSYGAGRLAPGTYRLAEPTETNTDKTVVENSFERFASPFGTPHPFHMAIIADVRAMKYGLPKELRVDAEVERDFTKTFETLLYSRYYLDSTRIFDPLVRTVHFTPSGKHWGRYTGTAIP